jgi:hypothetical protein
LAGASLVGIPPDKFLHAESDIELQCLILVAEKAVEYQQILYKNLALQIVIYFGQALSGKQSRGVQRDHRSDPQDQRR